MSLSVIQNATAIAPNVRTSFSGSGGTAPYTYTVLAGGAGGVIDSNGFYTAPNSYGDTPQTSNDIIQVTDSSLATATSTIHISTPAELICDILENQLQLQPDHIYLWDQKINQPTDNNLYIAVSVPSCRPFGNVLDFDATSTFSSSQYVTMIAQIDVDIISRGPAARIQKEQVLFALQSVYSVQQQELNSFYISRITNNFINLSNVDGAAIPYRYKITFNIQYAEPMRLPVPYFDSFQFPSLDVQPKYPIFPTESYFAWRTYTAAANPATFPFNSYSSFNTNWPWLSYGDAS